MIRNFLLNRNGRIEAKEIDTDTGRVKLYQINDGLSNCGINFPFSEYETTTANMGYSSVADMIKELKKRNQLGKEVPHDKQVANEISSILQLAKFRHENGWNLADIPEKLQKHYGLSKEYVDKIIRYITNHNIERHIIKVYTDDGDILTTEINGSPADIEKYYTEKIEFIA